MARLEHAAAAVGHRFQRLRPLPAALVAGRGEARAGALELGGHQRPVPARPGDPPADQRQHRRGALPLGRELLDETRHAVGGAGGQQVFGDALQQLLRLLPGEGAHQQRQPPDRVGLGFGRAPEQRREHFRALAPQPVLEEVAQQIVQAQRQLRRVQHGDEQPPTLDLLEQPLRARIARDMRAAGGGELGQHRAVQQEFAQPAEGCPRAAACARRRASRPCAPSTARRRRRCRLRR